MTPVATPSATPSATASATPTAPAVALEVHCDANLVLTVSSETVTATPAGVTLLVSSDAPAGIRLTYGTGGDPIPATPAEWVLTSPPGELALSCMSPDAEGELVSVTVADPGHHWQAATLEDFGCPPGAVPSWAIAGASGATADEAVANLMDNFNAGGRTAPLAVSLHAKVGYPDAATQTWILGTEDRTELTARVSGSDGGFDAWPDALCVASPWPGDPSA